MRIIRNIAIGALLVLMVVCLVYLIVHKQRVDRAPAPTQTVTQAPIQTAPVALVLRHAAVEEFILSNRRAGYLGVQCPDMVVKVGWEYNCFATDSTGQTIAIAVTITSESGGYTWAPV